MRWEINVRRCVHIHMQLLCTGFFRNSTKIIFLSTNDKSSTVSYLFYWFYIVALTIRIFFFFFAVGDDFFTVDPKTGSVNVINSIDREAYSFEDMDEPSVYLRLKISCPTGTAADDAAADQSAIKPLSLHGLLENIAYDPTTTLIQLVIVDANDNVPVFAEKHIVVGYPVLDVADVIVPKHLVQVKVSALPPRAPSRQSIVTIISLSLLYCFACVTRPNNYRTRRPVQDVATARIWTTKILLRPDHIISYGLRFFLFFSFFTPNISYWHLRYG